MEREKNNFYKRIHKYLSKYPNISNFDNHVDQVGQNIIINHAKQSIRAILASRTFYHTNKNILYVTKDDKIAEEIAEDFAVLHNDKCVFYIPDFETLPYEDRSPHYMIRAQRLKALTNILSSQNAIYILSFRTLIRNILNPQYLTCNILHIKTKVEYCIDKLISILVNMGYEYNNQIEKVGQVSKRGGVVDIFSPNYTMPVRLDFFGDEVTSIKYFSVNTQRSEKNNLQEITIIPCREVILNEEALHSIRAGIIALKGFYEGIEQDIALIYKAKHSLLDYVVPERTIIFLDNIILNNPKKPIVRDSNTCYEVDFGISEKITLDHIDQYQSEINDLYQRSIESDSKKIFPTPDRLILNREEVFSHFSRFPVHFLNTGMMYRSHMEVEKASFTEGKNYSYMQKCSQSVLISFDTYNAPETNSSIESLIDHIINFKEKNFKIFIQVENCGQLKRMEDLLDDYKEDVHFSIGVLHSGFVSPEMHLVVFTDHEIFKRYKHKKMDTAFSKGEAIVDYDSLKPGDYIVHIDHGIGVYEGLKTLNIAEKNMDCLCIQYAGSDKIYVPTWQLKLVAKYVSEEGNVPIIHKIGSKLWDLTKERAKKSIELVVEEIMQLYAERKLRKGISFNNDTDWQKEMEDSFIYDDTPDQTTATAEIKKDMESELPMERLLCGDVGFGKTEVAVRVAFKAVMSSYQVAVVVPTTLLAEQHYHVFRERLAQFPIKIAMLSRFRTSTQIKKDLSLIKDGKIDIIIGTHRILSKDVVFKKIGLLVIDEEHRFGVLHKDRIRQIKSNIDTLYMSATPIPRTMNMVISKLKSMSLIQTSPKARLPIRTVIVSYDTIVIKDAIQREYDRGGQTFFVHNRVESIENIYLELKSILPKLRMAIAHGQLPEKQLETIMYDFSKQKYDVLIATTIIESGIDIPNANTILINRADMFGLAQLYQIRGRVGRSNKRAYAYLIIPNNLSDIAKRRLETLTEYESLGAGYQIAMRDLEIRGAGTLLGTKQSGVITSVGFNFYNRLLDQAVNNIMAKNPKGIWDETEENEELRKIEIGTEFYFPAEYITNEKQKLSIYKRMNEFKDIKEFDDLLIELEDRFGSIPETAKNVIDYFKLRMITKNLGLKSFMILSNKIQLEYEQKKLPPKELLPKLINFSDIPVSFNTTSGLKIFFEFTPIIKENNQKKIDYALKIIDFLINFSNL